jgi:cutinase
VARIKRRYVTIAVLTGALLTAGGLGAASASASVHPWRGFGVGRAAAPALPARAQQAAPAAAAGSCPDVELVFARGTGELPGLGIVGNPLANALRSGLSGRTFKASAVNYAADASQASAGPGSTDMTQQVSQAAAACPSTTFVIGGYSQGATVTDLAMGIQVGVTRGTAIPGNLTGRVAAVVVYGNPLGIGHQTIAQRSAVFGPKAKEFCNAGDPVCGNGNNIAAHLAYATNGTVQLGAQFALGKLG